MRYLVTLQTVEEGIPSGAPQQLIQYLEQIIIASHEALMKLEAERKILAGGVLTGASTAAFIVDAASNQELIQLLQSLPCWGWMKVDVTPLESFEGSAAQVRQIIEHLKEAA